MMQLRDGRYSFRLMEPMEEVVYLDQVRLLAMDHPAGVDVYPDELRQQSTVSAVQGCHEQQRASAGRCGDDHGPILLPDLLAHKYVGDFEILPFKGFTKPHSIELDLGDAYRGGPSAAVAPR